MAFAPVVLDNHSVRFEATSFRFDEGSLRFGILIDSARLIQQAIQHSVSDEASRGLGSKAWRKHVVRSMKDDG